MKQLQVGEQKTLTIYGVRGRDRVRLSAGEFAAEAEHPGLLSVTPSSVPDEFILVGKSPGVTRVQMAWQDGAETQTGSVEIEVRATPPPVAPVSGLAGSLE